jgi:protocatechuate 3,4-dioxygenase beta subunit
MRLLRLISVFSAGLVGAESVTLTGKVVDASGKPVEHATVLVYEAFVKTGSRKS